ncbi:hypothetical protein ACUOFU_16905 [Microbacterium arabinogalactanolyticum]|uniref:hypothetical protein n=1 Tax=Microbacterium arabinogalactanolyticum TaxID=69365 RepID=UPI00404515FA
MKLAAGMVIGVTVMIVWHVMGWPFVEWVFTRIPPATHPDCAPRARAWHHGVEVSCPPLSI